MNDLGADELCKCTSGKLYKDCHQPIIEAASGQAISVAREIYVAEYGQNAELYKAQGLYDDLANELIEQGNIEKILDIGCGLGHGLEALAHAIQDYRFQIVGVDENSACLREAASRLGLSKEQPFNNRLTEFQIADYVYRSDIGDKPVTICDNGFTLIQTDVFFEDRQLDDALNEIGELDAVILWFSGAHKGRSLTEIVQEMDIRSDEQHRLNVEAVSLEIAITRLKTGGYFQMATRIATHEVEKELLRAESNLTEMLEDSGLKLKSIRAISYNESASPTAIKVKSVIAEQPSVPTYVISFLVEKQFD